MKKLHVFFCSLFLLSGFASLHAQKLWSLEDCINYAYENNLIIKRQQLDVRYNKNNLTQSYFNTLPNMNGSVNEGFSSGQAFDYFASPPHYKKQNTWSGSIGISSNITLFGGFQNLNNILKSKYSFLKSQSDLQKSKNDIAVQMALAYLQVLFSKELVDVSRSKLEVTSMQVERTKKMLDVGNVAQGDFLQIKAQESNDKTSLINAQNNMGIAYLNLTQMLDLDSTGGFDIVVPQNIEVELVAPLTSVKEIYDTAVQIMPEIRSADFALKIAQKQLSIAWGAVSPTVSLNGSLSTFYSTNASDPLNPDVRYPVKSQFKDYYNKQIGFGVSIPIFNRLQVKNSISNATLQVRDYKLQLDQAKMALYKEIQQAHADAAAARQKYYSSVEAVNYNEEAFKYTSQKFEVGLVNSVDYNVAQNNLISAKSDMLQAKYDYIFRLKILDLYMNKEINL